MERKDFDRDVNENSKKMLQIHAPVGLKGKLILQNEKEPRIED
jgi:hypothetical protein